MNEFSITGTTSHSTTIYGLANGTIYNYYIKCQDTVGNFNNDDFTITFRIATAIINISNIDDAYIRNDVPDTNHGGSSRFLIDGAPVIYRTLIKPLDLGGIPPNTTILKAELVLTAYDLGSPANASKVLSTWNENTVTWNTLPAIESMPFTTFRTNSTTVIVDITSLMQEWINSEPIYGVLLWSFRTDGSDYRSTEYSIVAQRPKIIVMI